MKNERPIRVFIGLAIMAATVSAAGTIGGWTRPEPPSDHATTAKAPVKPAAKPETKAETKPETKSKPAAEPPSSMKFEPAWNEPRSAAVQGGTSKVEHSPARPQAAAPPTPKTQEAPHAESTTVTSPSPDDAMKLLEEGNARWAASNPQSPNLSEGRRRSLAENGQTPFAAILTCADSRVPVERVFDRGVGDLFVIRVAGNVAGPHEAGTIEYGAEHLHVPLLVVMGHTKCGAVGAAASHAPAPGNVSSLVNAIAPAVERAEALNPSLKEGALVEAAVRENVWQSVFDLIRSSAVCRERIGSGQLRVVGAVYNIATGEVEWLGEHPWQRELIAAMNAREGERQANAPTEPAGADH